MVGQGVGPASGTQGLALRGGKAGKLPYRLRRGFGILGPDGDPAGRLGGQVVPRLDGLDHGLSGHHVVDQLVGADPEAEEGLPLEPDVEDVHPGEQGGHGGLGHRGQGEGGADPLVPDPGLQAGFLGSVPHQQETGRGSPVDLGRVQEGIQGVGQAVGPGVADQEGTVQSRLPDRGPVGLRQFQDSGLPLRGVDPVGNADELARRQAPGPHVALRTGQEGHDPVAVAVGVVLRRLHGQNEGMKTGVAAQLDRGEGPEVVDLVDEPGPEAARDGPGGIVVQGVGGGGDDRVGPEIRKSPAGPPVEPPDKGGHVPDPPQAVALVGRCAQPDVLDPVDVLAGFPPVHHGVPASQMAVVRGHDPDPVPHPHPFTGQVVGTVFHPVSRGAGVVVDEEEVG